MLEYIISNSPPLVYQKERFKKIDECYSPMDIHAMQEAGLTEGEAKVYLALMDLGPSTTGPIIEKAHVAKSIIYQLLDKLIQKGLVAYITKEKTKYFQASDPHKLIEYMETNE